MKEEILKKILQLDSLCNILTWYERAMIHLFISGKISQPVDMLPQLYNWILQHRWEPPEMLYRDDRILYFFDPNSGHWYADQFYLKINHRYKESLTVIANKKL